MAKTRLLSGREICSILARYGFMEVRRRGSHIVMQKKHPDTTITVPVPDHKVIRIGTNQSSGSLVCLVASLNDDLPPLYIPQNWVSRLSSN